MFRSRYAVFLLVILLVAPGTRAGAEVHLDLKEFAGKVVIVDFWASWCVPCRRSFPWMNRMQARYADLGLVIIGVNLDQDREQAAEFLEEIPASFTIFYDDEAALAREFDVEAMPSSFVIGRDGHIVARHLGFKVKRQDEYEAVLRDALGVE